MVDAVSPFFIVRDLDRALAFYRDVLGFEVTFASGGFFAIVRRGGVQFLLKSVGVDAQPNRTRHADARWDAFVHVADPDALAAELSTQDVVPIDTDDGLRGFELVDADGYVLFFGRPR
jgi:catechol 2,3-dioxygenase-like lactoylglutathione lyase family enzyme